VRALGLFRGIDYLPWLLGGSRQVRSQTVRTLLLLTAYLEEGS